MKLKSIPEHTVVHTPTEEEAKELLTILHENGYKLHCGWHIDACYNTRNGHVYWDNRAYYEKQGYTILTLAEFKELYVLNEDNFAKSEEEKSQPKFKVGDKVVWGECDTIYTIEEVSTTYKIRNSNGLSYSYAKECNLAPYTEPETKPTEKETKESEETFASKELNLCELLAGYVGEMFYSPIYGNIQLCEIGGDTFPLITEGANFMSDGRVENYQHGHCMLFPSRALYEQYPLDAAQAWSVWLEEQKKPFICIHWGEVDCNGDIKEEDYTGNTYFRTLAYRDRCIEEIKAIIEKYNKN